MAEVNNNRNKKNLTKITTPLHVTVIHVTTGMYNKYMNVLSSKIKYY